MEENKITVSKIEFRTQNHLQVFLPPGKYPSWFQAVYRGARGVYWNESGKFFYLKFQTDLSWEKAFMIVYETVLYELGYVLLIGSDTEMIGIEPEVSQTKDAPGREESKPAAEKESACKGGKTKRTFRKQLLIVCAIGTACMFNIARLTREDLARVFLGYGTVVCIAGIAYWACACLLIDADTLLLPYSRDFSEKKIEIRFYQTLRCVLLWSCFLAITVMRVGMILSFARQMPWFMIPVIGLAVILFTYLLDAVLIWMFFYQFNYRIVIGNGAIFIFSFKGKLSRYGIDEVTRLSNRYGYFSLVVGNQNILIRKSRCSDQDAKNMDQAYEYLKDKVKGLVP